MAEVGMTKVKRGRGWFNEAARALEERTLLASTPAAKTQSTDWEGSTRRFNDVHPTTGARRSQRDVQCILVRNMANYNLLPKRGVTWLAGYRGRRVGGHLATTAGRAAGIVDEYFNSAGVPPGELFWLTIGGPTLWKKPNADQAIAAGDVLVGLTGGVTTDGYVGKQDLTGATAPLAEQIQNRVAIAIEASSNSLTGADVLVDVLLY